LIEWEKSPPYPPRRFLSPSGGGKGRISLEGAGGRVLLDRVGDSFSG